MRPFTAARIAVALTAVVVATVTLGSTAANASTATSKVTLRPVSADGHVRSGYVVQHGHATIDCTGADRSPAATTGGILLCSPSAADAIACWRANDHALAYCLVNVWKHLLVRYALAQHHFPNAGPTGRPAAPLALVLDNDDHCTIRDGGAGPTQAHHPTWAVYYYCLHGAVFAAPNATYGGLNRAKPRWTVWYGATSGAGYLHSHAVTKAYFVAA